LDILYWGEGEDAEMVGEDEGVKVKRRNSNPDFVNGVQFLSFLYKNFSLNMDLRTGVLVGNICHQTPDIWTEDGI